MDGREAITREHTIEIRTPAVQLPDVNYPDRKKNNLADVLPGYMIGGDEFLNNQAKLPHAPGRTWYEADIDYTYGKRTLKRVLYSNDGLVFVTEDHYQTFYEITR